MPVAGKDRIKIVNFPVKQVAVIGASALILGGCALPIPLQVASWVLDGISVLATEKSVADHGISIVAQSDCAVWRGVVDGELCRDWEPGETMVAAANPEVAPVEAAKALRQSLAAVAGSETPSPATQSIAANALLPVVPGAVAVDKVEIEIDKLDIDKLANFETAAGGESTVERIELPTLPALDITSDLVLELAPTVVTFSPVVEPTVEVAVVEPVPVAAKLVAAKLVPAKLARNVVNIPSDVAPEAGIYFVIGSFRNHGNAKVLAGRHEGFVPEVLAARLDGAPVYRVVVGPVANGREKAIHRRLSRAGLLDTWAIRVVPGDWQLASAIVGSRSR